MKTIKMIQKILILTLFLLLISTSTHALSIPREPTHQVTPYIIVPILGLFPTINDQNITFWAVLWWTMNASRFHGHISTIIIIGYYIFGGGPVTAINQIPICYSYYSE